MRWEAHSFVDEYDFFVNFVFQNWDSFSWIIKQFLTIVSPEITKLHVHDASLHSTKFVLFVVYSFATHNHQLMKTGRLGNQKILHVRLGYFLEPWQNKIVKVILIGGRAPAVLMKFEQYKH